MLFTSYELTQHTTSWIFENRILSLRGFWLIEVLKMYLIIHWILDSKLKILENAIRAGLYLNICLKIMYRNRKESFCSDKLEKMSSNYIFSTRTLLSYLDICINVRKYRMDDGGNERIHIIWDINPETRA